MRPRGAPLANLPNVDVNTGAACRGWARAVKDIARQSFEVSPTIRSSLKVALGGGRTDVLPDSVSDPAYATTKGRRLDRHDGAAERIRLVGGEAGPGTQPALRVEWLPALQLPALIVRRAKDGSAVRVELAQRAVAPPADWRLPDAERTLECARIDAAGFGAMACDPVVRKAEAMDVRAGWREAHAPKLSAPRRHWPGAAGVQALAAP